MLASYKWEDDYVWASLDVYSLYTSNPHEVGLTALQYFLTKDHQGQFIIDSSKFSLEHTYFVFLDEFYLQRNGPAMGDSYAPCYANITMGYWEEHYITQYIILHGRYIGDILII